MFRSGRIHFGIVGGYMGFFSGSKGGYKQISNLTPQQQQVQNKYVSGAGKAFGDLYNYYGGLMSGQGSDVNAFMAPEMRRFNEQIIPGLSEQFAGMGSGALSSSGFRNAAVGAGTDLSERLGALRAQLRQQGAQGLQGLAQGALQPTVENVYEAPTPGFMENALGGLTRAGLDYMLPGAGSALKSFTGNFGKSSPYGGKSTQPLSTAYDQEFRQRGLPMN